MRQRAILVTGGRVLGNLSKEYMLMLGRLSMVQVEGRAFQAQGNMGN